ncbi:uncharacterized protein C14orf119 [Diaphorina citri]|jgi:hypothetical protein|uniref:Uncharacterized protein C14orf119 n=1 Tax=Diaphorina citri TaxID=121845 RepID=A0A1S4EG26_DIACI|nr:uncharacterized protein C14orf119 [Diaphorina citri]XP_026682113.1 uncharacterized protein C14orf119 [Diaphorina citri]KAI5706410.1 hypothetical protein M8J75_007879 [Diaphorina citri]KAI5740727.1 hypothetical protein M8J76_006518 [Diaphorina citri]KAI5746252.1 hypothetical protein M8J77_001538 [Diaphorina citri]
MGSASNDFTPTFQTQLRYLNQWFLEWSEMQRCDFLPILLNKFSSKSTMNGIIPSLESLSTEENNRPPSLFQCRIKLFHDWTTNWTDIEKEQFVNSLKSIDEEFMKKYDEELMLSSSDKLETNNNVKEIITNGDHKEQDVDLEDNII